MEYVPLYTLTPRFILSIRELHARDVQGRRGEGIDSGFGLAISSRSAGGTAVVLDVAQDEEGGGDINEVRRVDRNGLVEVVQRALSV